MDNKNPQIISSGARHSVQVGLDNKNAQTKRNLVKSDEAQAPEQVLANETQAERAAAQLRQGVQVEAVRGGGDQNQTVEEAQREGQKAFVGEGAVTQNRAQAPTADADSEGPAQAAVTVREAAPDNMQGLGQETLTKDRLLGGQAGALSDDELKAAKNQAALDRELKVAKDQPEPDSQLSAKESVGLDRDLKAKKQAAEADTTLSAHEDAAQDRDLKAKKQAVADDGILSGEENQLPDREGRGPKALAAEDEALSAREALPLDNRQKMDALAQATERIALQAQALDGGPARADNPLDVKRVLAQLQGEPDAEVAQPELAEEKTPAVAMAPQPEPELSPELAGNLPVMSAAEIAESEFLRRINALKTNMTVTDGVLTQLQTPPRK
jgi:hypothetical protein